MRDVSQTPLYMGAFDIDTELGGVVESESVERVVLRSVGAGRQSSALREEEQIPPEMPDVLLDPVPE